MTQGSGRSALPPFERWVSSACPPNRRCDLSSRPALHLGDLPSGEVPSQEGACVQSRKLRSEPGDYVEQTKPDHAPTNTSTPTFIIVTDSAQWLAVMGRLVSPAFLGQ